jgi:hypothetical protein
MTTLPFQQLDDATRIVADEIDIVEAETSAYRRFIRRLDELEPNHTDVTISNDVAGGVVRSSGRITNASSQLKRAQAAYRETVMSTDHFATEYGKCLREHVAAEFNDALADDEGDIQLDRVDGGVVYRGILEDDYNIATLEPVIVGPDFTDSPSDADDALRNIDNGYAMPDGRVLCCEDGFGGPARS